MDVDEVIELRVHGVSGTPPEDLLARRLVDRVAGDTIAGFYRSTAEAERRDSVPAGAEHPVIRGPVMEGYAWGGLTSGAPLRAFWLLLLPFSLINVAPRLRPPDPPDPSARSARARLWSIWFLCRVLALVLTVVLVFAFAGIGVDLVGWQCGSGRCANASPGWLMDWITALSAPRRLAVGALLPFVALLGLWFVSWRAATRTEYLAPVFGASDRVVDEARDAVEVTLDSRWMWDNEQPVRRMRALHLQVGAAVTLSFVAAPMITVWRWCDAVVAIAVSALALVLLCVPGFTGHGGSPRWRLVSGLVWVVLGLAVAGTFATLLLDDHALDAARANCSTVDGSYVCTPGGGYPGFAGALLWLLMAQLVLLLVLLGLVLAAASAAARPTVLGDPGPRPGLGGTGTYVMALAAVFLGSVFTAGTYLFAGAWLHTGSLRPSLATMTRVPHYFAVPEVIVDFGLAYAIAVAMAVVVLVLFGAWAVRSSSTVTRTSAMLEPGAFVADYGDVQPPGAARERTILRAMWAGRIVDRAGIVLGVLMGLGAVLTYVFAVILVAEHLGIGWGVDAADRLVGEHGAHARPGFFSAAALQAKGAYLAVWTLLLLVTLGALAFRVPATRRSVGILWDLASFWPRLSHPLAAPCYAERTVPDLITRVRWHADSGRGVVLAAHSQGTVISAATVLQLATGDATRDDPVLDRVALLTFGCVLRRLYGRYFPAWFGQPSLGALAAALSAPGDAPRWRNLWRYTDYLGGPVLSGPRSGRDGAPVAPPPWQAGDCGDPAGTGPVRVDVHLRDPQWGPPPGDTVDPPPGRHSNFWAVPEFQRAVVVVADLVKGRH